MKGFTKKQVLEAIKQCEFTYKSVADYLSQFSPDGKCSEDTAKRYIEKFGEETKNAFKASSLSLRDLSIRNIKRALERGDVKTAKWLLERLERFTFGNEITVNTDSTEPLNINLSGSGDMTAEELLNAENTEAGGMNE